MVYRLQEVKEGFICCGRKVFPFRLGSCFFRTSTIYLRGNLSASKMEMDYYRFHGKQHVSPSIRLYLLISVSFLYRNEGQEELVDFNERP